jgi:hypothetical protein
LGLVTLRDPGVEALEMTAFASQELKALIGPVRVRIHPSAALVLTDNNMLQSASFFLTYMTPGATLVNVSGSLGVGGELLASRVELEDQVPIVGGVFPVCMEGRVVELGTNHNLGLLVRSISRGRQIVQPYLDGLADPSTLLVTYDPTSVLIFVDDDQQVSPLELSPGQEIALKFRSFQGEPFLSWRMSIASDG